MAPVASNAFTATSIVVTLPVEIITVIIDTVASYDDGNHNSVKACSLTCQLFLPLCRKHIFSTINLKYGWRSMLLPDQFKRLITHSPWIAQYIQTLRCAPDHGFSFDDSELKGLTKLHTLIIVPSAGNMKCNWGEVRRQEQSVLLRLLHLPTIVNLKLSSVQNFIPSDLIPCTNLKLLDLFWQTTVVENEPENSPFAHSPYKSIHLDKMHIHSHNARNIATMLQPSHTHSQPIINLGELKRIAFTMDGNNEDVLEILKSSHSLEAIHFQLNYNGFNEFSDANIISSSLLTSRLNALRSLVVSVNSPATNALTRICEELQKIVGQMCFENFELNLTDTASSLPDNEWKLLHDVLSESLEWPSLRQVDIHIFIVAPFSGHPAAVEDAIIKLEKAYGDVYIAQLSNLSFAGTFKLSFYVTRGYYSLTSV